MSICRCLKLDFRVFAKLSVVVLCLTLEPFFICPMYAPFLMGHARGTDTAHILAANEYYIPVTRI